MNTIRILSSIILLIISCFPTNLSAQNCEVTKYISNCEVLKNKLCITDSIELKILNRSGEEYTNISIPYSKNEKLSNIEGWIEDKAGRRVRNLTRNEITDQSDFSDMSLYEDNFLKKFQLKYNDYPYKVCYTYRTTLNQFIAVANWTPALFARIPTRDAKLVVIMPKNYKYKIFMRDVTFVKSDTLEKQISSVYTAKYINMDEEEPNAQPLEDIKPKLIIIPEQFSYGITGSTADWKSIGNWYFNLNKGLNDLPASEKEIIAQEIKGITDKVEIIKILYHYVQDHTRYINVSIGVGGLKAYPASYVAQNKYGDCKALTNYMKALLEFAGINSKYVLLNRDLHPNKIIDDLPFPQFNHVILAVPLNRDTIWIENTENSEAFNYVGSSIQNRKGLLIDENDSKLISIPAFKKKDVELVRNIDVLLNNQGSGEVNVVFSFKGYYYEIFNEFNAGYNKDKQDNLVKDYMPFNNYEVLDWKLSKGDRDTAKIKLAAKLNLIKMMKRVGDEYYFNTFPVMTGVYGPPNARKLPIVFTYPVFNTDNVTFTIPEGLEVKAIPKDQVISSQFGKYEVHFSFAANVVHVSKKFELYTNEYSIEQYKFFYDFYKSLKELEKNPIILKMKN